MPKIDEEIINAPAAKLSVVSVDTATALQQYWAELEVLCEHVSEQNVFYEPWMIIPAVDAFGKDKTFSFVLVYSESPQSNGNRLLSGFFPFERRRRYARMPANLLLLWEYRHCGVCTPLIRQGHEKACINALLDWAKSDGKGADVIEWFQVASDGPIYRALLECVEERKLRHQLTKRERPIMLPRENSDVFINEALSSNRKRGLRRWERQLGELGPVEYKEFAEDKDGNLDQWIADFFEMEASGWKGQEGVAAIFDEHTAAFVRNALKEAYRRNQLLTLAMTVGGEPAASRFILTSRGGSFGYKISYREKYARYSPGSLLEIESIRRVHQHPEIKWLDSCVAPSFAHYLPWLDKMGIADISLSSGTLKGNIALALAPKLRSLGKSLQVWKERRKNPPVEKEAAQPNPQENPENLK